MGLVDVGLGSGAKPGSQSAGDAEVSRSLGSLMHTEPRLSRVVSRILRSMDLAFIVEKNKC